MWNLPGPGIEPVSPALAGGLFTTGPPGKSLWEASLSYSQTEREGMGSKGALPHCNKHFLPFYCVQKMGFWWFVSTLKQFQERTMMQLDYEVPSKKVQWSLNTSLILHSFIHWMLLQYARWFSMWWSVITKKEHDFCFLPVFTGRAYYNMINVSNQDHKIKRIFEIFRRPFP